MKKTMLAAAWLLFSVIVQAGNGKNGNPPQPVVDMAGERGVESVVVSREPGGASDEGKLPLRRHEIGFHAGLFGECSSTRDERQTAPKDAPGGDCCDDDFCGLRLAAHITAAIEYYYNIDRHWAVGGLVATGSGAHSFNGPSGCEERRGSNIWFAMPHARFTWLHSRFDILRLYSRIGLGYLWQHLSAEQSCAGRVYAADHRSRLAYQVSVVGVEFGCRAVRLYSECGYGVQGVFTLGVKYAW